MRISTDRQTAMRLITIVLVLASVLVTGPAVAAQPPQPATEEFVPIDQLPPDEQLAAAPLLVTAYAFAWVALLAYLWSIWRRLERVERELADVARRAGAPARRA